MDLDQTIVAISTASGVGAIAVVRLSGAKALAIINCIFRPGDNGYSQAELKSHQARHGFIFDTKSMEMVDEVVVTAFLAHIHTQGKM